LKKPKKIDANNRQQSSVAVESFFEDAIAKVKAEAEAAIVEQKAKSEAEAAKAIAMVKAEAQEKAKAYTDTISRIKAEVAEAIARVKAEAEEKARTYTDTIARIKAQLEEKARVYTGTAGKDRPSATVEVLFSDAVAKQKAKSEAERAETIARVKAEAEEAIAEQKAKSEAEAAEAIARVKVEAEQKTRAYVDAMNRIKAEAEEKARACTDSAGKGKPSAKVDALFSEAVAKLRAKSEAEVEEKARAYTGTAGKVKAEADEAIAKIEAKAAKVIARIRAEAEGETSVYTDTAAKGKDQPVSGAIKRMVQSQAVLPGEHFRKTSALRTKDVMQRNIIWGSPDDSVQQAFAKMQQHGASYMMVGRNGVLEGIVSRSDLTGAISPYLRPIFAKWRTPADDATLQIRIKWIMSRPVHTISPQMPFNAIVTNMCRSRVLALPVADQQGKVLGLVTGTDLFKAILKLRNGTGIPTSGKGRQGQSAPPQAPECSKTQLVMTNQPSQLTA